jgi:hypothetical protein
MAVPASTREIESFTPPSLKNLPVPPDFLLRPADGRELRAFEYRLMAEGLQTHDTDAFRAEMLKALEALYSPDQFAEAKARLVSFWALCDQNGKPEPDEAAAISDLTGRLIKAWRPLSAMAADNKRFQDECGRIAVSMFCIGWTGIETPYSREQGFVPLGKIDAVELDLAGLEKKARENKVEGVGSDGTAFMQLATAAYLRLALTWDEEKNSSSPPPSRPVLNGSTKRPSKRMGAARSKASASSGSSKAN